ncbi:hypothetical protein [Extibacter muris]|nr:hypothetical protein [Extibacter muris]MCB6203130.1 hypothetical protein [Extibacter muris]MCQ4664355.1 hypothetical protein [Extibacter muris]MCQ4692307.1 hypothetical protein [Extibacter muris]MCQ4692448.1 hypothetical protein [Extibacter muris]
MSRDIIQHLETEDGQLKLKDAAELLGDSYEVILTTYFHTDREKKIELVDAIA